MEEAAVMKGIPWKEKKGIIDGEKEEGEEEITHSQGEKTAGERREGEGRGGGSTVWRKERKRRIIDG